MHRSIKPPYCPTVINPTDCFNFEEFDYIDPVVPQYSGNFDYKSF